MSACPACRGGVRQAVDHDVEQRHRFLPPGHEADGAEPECSDRCVGVVPHASVEVDDVGAALVLGGPQVGAERGLVVPSWEVLGERSIEHLAEVPRIPDGGAAEAATAP